MKVYRTKLGRWPALVDSDGHLVQTGESHQANESWARVQGYEVVAAEDLVVQLDLFGQKKRGASR